MIKLSNPRKLTIRRETGQKVTLPKILKNTKIVIDLTKIKIETDISQRMTEENLVKVTKRSLERMTETRIDTATAVVAEINTKSPAHLEIKKIKESHLRNQKEMNIKILVNLLYIYPCLIIYSC